MDSPTIVESKPKCMYDGMNLRFNFIKERVSEATFMDWPTVEGYMVAQVLAAAVVLNLLL